MQGSPIIAAIGISLIAATPLAAQPRGIRPVGQAGDPVGAHIVELPRNCEILTLGWHRISKALKLSMAFCDGPSSDDTTETLAPIAWVTTSAPGALAGDGRPAVEVVGPAGNPVAERLRLAGITVHEGEVSLDLTCNTDRPGFTADGRISTQLGRIHIRAVFPGDPVPLESESEIMSGTGAEGVFRLGAPGDRLGDGVVFLSAKGSIPWLGAAAARTPDLVVLYEVSTIELDVAPAVSSCPTFP